MQYVDTDREAGRPRGVSMIGVFPGGREPLVCYDLKPAHGLPDLDAEKHKQVMIAIGRAKTYERPGQIKPSEGDGRCRRTSAGMEANMVVAGRIGASHLECHYFDRRLHQRCIYPIQPF